MQSNMNVFIVWAWMLSLSYALEHERYCGWGMDALDSGHHTQSNMHVVMVWAWMLSLSYAVVHERYYRWGMDALVTACTRT